MWAVICCMLIVAPEVSTVRHERAPLATFPVTNRFVMNSTEVIELQLNPGSTSLQFQVCHKPRCNGVMTLWYAAAVANDVALTTRRFCFVKEFFSTGNETGIDVCVDGEISSKEWKFNSHFAPNLCGLDISVDGRLKVRLESIVYDCEISVTNGVIWTGPSKTKNELTLEWIIGMPVGVVVLFGVSALIIVLAGRFCCRHRTARSTPVTVAEVKVNTTHVSNVARNYSSQTSLPSSALSASSLLPPSSGPLATSTAPSSIAPTTQLTAPSSNAPIEVQ